MQGCCRTYPGQVSPLLPSARARLRHPPLLPPPLTSASTCACAATSPPSAAGSCRTGARPALHPPCVPQVAPLNSACSIVLACDGTYPVWQVSVDVCFQPLCLPIEYKYVVCVAAEAAAAGVLEAVKWETDICNRIAFLPLARTQVHAHARRLAAVFAVVYCVTSLSHPSRAAC